MRYIENCLDYLYTLQSHRENFIEHTCETLEDHSLKEAHVFALHLDLTRVQTELDLIYDVINGLERIVEYANTSDL